MASCLNPIQLSIGGNYIRLPCNKCTQCRTNRRNAWSFRLFQEKKSKKWCHFLTLTYNPDFIPRDKKGGYILLREDISNFINDFQTYLKNKYYTIVEKEYKGKNKKIKVPKYYMSYYYVGEYGDIEEDHRPHYHALVFFDTPIDEIDEAQNLWQLGIIQIDDVTTANIHYCSKHNMKVSWNKKNAPSFCGMSKKQSIGSLVNIDTTKTVIYNGFTLAPIQYYKKRLQNIRKKFYLDYDYNKIRSEELIKVSLTSQASFKAKQEEYCKKYNVSKRDYAFKRYLDDRQSQSKLQLQYKTKMLLKSQTYKYKKYHEHSTNN